VSLCASLVATQGVFNVQVNMMQLGNGGWTNNASSNGCSIKWEVLNTTDILFGEPILIAGDFFLF
jgi:hypothetical protein